MSRDDITEKVRSAVQDPDKERRRRGGDPLVVLMAVAIVAIAAVAIVSIALRG